MWDSLNRGRPGFNGDAKSEKEHGTCSAMQNMNEKRSDGHSATGVSAGAVLDHVDAENKAEARSGNKDTCGNERGENMDVPCIRANSKNSANKDSTCIAAPNSQNPETLSCPHKDLADREVTGTHLSALSQSCT